MQITELGQLTVYIATATNDRYRQRWDGRRGIAGAGVGRRNAAWRNAGDLEGGQTRKRPMSCRNGRLMRLLAPGLARSRRHSMTSLWA